ncbi:MAG: alkaline phosphatase family protein [Halapricum sp.]
MLRSGVEQRLREEYEQNGYLRPAYDDYCFGNVPDTVRSLLSAGGRRSLPGDVFEGIDTDVERVVLVLVDGYGLDAWKRDRDDHAFLDRLTDRGTVTPLTSVYPSETAAAITTLETGQLPCEHGRLGWNVYDPDTDRSFLAFSGRVKGGPTEGLATVDGAAVAPEHADSIDYHYAAMADRGVDCHRLQPFSEAADGSTQHEYDGLDDFGTRLREVTESTGAPGYVYAYLPAIDHVSHHHGTDSEQFQQTVAGVCEQLSTFVSRLDPAVASETLLVVTADHGHVNTVPERNVDLSNNDALIGNLRRHADGTPVTMAGSPRNVHLHLRDGTVEQTRAALSDLDAHLFTRAEVLDSELFGDRTASERFERRCGDLVLTHRELGAWYGDEEPDDLDLVGMHGGMHPAEMLVPFAAVRADRLV